MHVTPSPPGARQAALRTTRRVAQVALVALACGGPVLAGDWPQFRGPQRDGISKETGLKRSWEAGGPQVLWRVPLGEGYSGISVSGNRLYTMYARGTGAFAAAFDAASGKELWRYRMSNIWNDRQGDGPRSTPTVDDGVVYAVSAHGVLAALDADDGKLLWRHDLVDEYGARIPRWGMSGSPLVEGRLLLVEVGGTQALLAAFDKKSGKQIWTSQSGKPGYASPLALTVGGVRQVVLFAGTKLLAVSPEDGRLLWERPWKTSWDVNAAMPVFVAPDKLFVSSGYDVGAQLLRLRVDGRSVRVEELWRSREMKNRFSSSVLHDGHAYGFDEKILKCVDLASGAMVWRARDLGHGSLILADGHLIVMGDRGQLALVEATPEGYREKARAQIFDGKTWTLPTLSGGKLYLRDEHELISLNVGG